jgi:hypothetical protein
MTMMSAQTLQRAKMMSVVAEGLVWAPAGLFPESKGRVPADFDWRAQYQDDVSNLVSEVERLTIIVHALRARETATQELLALAAAKPSLEAHPSVVEPTTRPSLPAEPSSPEPAPNEPAGPAPTDVA